MSDDVVEFVRERFGMQKPVLRLCSVEGCAKPHAAHGFCGMHAWRVRKYGTTELPEKSPPPSPTPEQIIVQMREAYAELQRWVEAEQ